MQAQRSKAGSDKPKTDVYAEVTAQIVRALEEGTVPWRKPWRAVGGDLPRNFVSQKPYRGINLLLLSLTPYGSPYWGTFKQVQEAGGRVRKGEKSTLIVFWKRLLIEDKDTGEKRMIPMLRHYRVFNAEQCDGLTLPEPEPLPSFDPSEAADAIINGYADGPTISYGGDKACYVPGWDAVKLPVREAFESPGAFYNTALHELVHSTGHEKRLARDFGKSFGDDLYSREELVAEMGACFLTTMAGMPDTLPASASYIASWLRALADDPKMVVWAAGKAQRAADHILGITHED